MEEILRWYVSRIYEDQKLVKGKYQFIEVKIVPTNKKSKIYSEGLITEKSDNLNWWTDDENLFLFGYIDEGTLIEVLENRNLQILPQLEFKPIKKRRITEGTVLLQFFNNDIELLNHLKKLRKRKAIPNLRKLATMEGTKWIDFTQQARKMSSSIYKEVLGAGGEIHEAE